MNVGRKSVKKALWFSFVFPSLHSKAFLHWNLHQFMFYCLARKYARRIIMFVTNRPTARYNGLTSTKFSRNKCLWSHVNKDGSCQTFIAFSGFCRNKGTSWNIHEGRENIDDRPMYPYKNLIVWRDSTRSKILATNHIYHTVENCM